MKQYKVVCEETGVACKSVYDNPNEAAAHCIDLNNINYYDKYIVKEFGMDLQLISNIEFDGINRKDYPDFCDAFIVSAEYNGEAMTDEQLDEINDNRDFVYEKLMQHLF